ncbi:hypothetical protein FACS1894167_07030 [Synergistales bacterium]|nr:hypothetical protein FACS1894167_07030 [Synergistales bacterium]
MRPIDGAEVPHVTVYAIIKQETAQLMGGLLLDFGFYRIFSGVPVNG